MDILADNSRKKHADHKKIDKQQLKRIQHKYKQYKQERESEIKKIFYITREEEQFAYLNENTAVIQARIKTPHKRRRVKDKTGIAQKGGL